jgi:hypothetical protein
MRSQHTSPPSRRIQPGATTFLPCAPAQPATQSQSPGSMNTFRRYLAPYAIGHARSCIQFDAVTTASSTPSHLLASASKLSLRPIDRRYYCSKSSGPIKTTFNLTPLFKDLRLHAWVQRGTRPPGTRTSAPPWLKDHSCRGRHTTALLRL